MVQILQTCKRHSHRENIYYIIIFVFRVRPQDDEYIASRPLSKIKHRAGMSVLGRVTTRESIAVERFWHFEHLHSALWKLCTWSQPSLNPQTTEITVRLVCLR